MTGRRPKPAYHHGDLRAALLRAAEELLQGRGIGAVSLRAVAKRAGVSHSAPYRHFPDKQALLAALAERGYARLRDALTAVAAAQPEDPRQQLVEAAAAYVGLATASPELTHLMFGGVLPEAELDEALAKTSGETFQALLDIIDNGMRLGLYRDRPTREVAAAAWSLVHGLAMLVSTGALARSGVTPDAQSLARDMAGKLIDGIASGSAAKTN